MNNKSISKFIELNKKLFFKNRNKFKINNKECILIEFNKWSCNHISISNCLLSLNQKKNHKVIAFPENGFDYFLNERSIVDKSKFILGQKFGINNFGVYKSFGTNQFLNVSNNNKYQNLTNKVFKKVVNKIKNKNDLLDLKLKNILIGDLIYDSYLKKYKKETIDINSKMFINFLKISLDYFFFWIEQFKLNNIKSVISSQSVYLSSLPLRISTSKNLLSLVANPERLYHLTKKNIYSDKEFQLFNKLKKNINKKNLIKGIKISEKKIKKRFQGKLGSDLSYLSKTAYGKFVGKRILKINKKFKVLIAPHSFSDAPHQLGKHLFPDYYEWLNFVISNTSDKYDWYIKCHPNFVDYFDNTLSIVKRMIKKNNNIKYLKPNISHRQLIKEGIKAVVTCHGTIGSEYPYFNLKVVNASNSNPHVNYRFNLNPKNKNQLKKILNNLENEKIRIIKREILEYYFMKNIYFSNDWLFENFDSLIKFCNGYKGIYTNKSYDFWLKNWNEKKQKRLTSSINKFLSSKEYMMNFKHKNIKLEQHINENFI
jgi:hypothetical protein